MKTDFVRDLWGLVLESQQVDPLDLAEAIQVQLENDQLDFRTRLLIRDSLEALGGHWGPNKLRKWLEASPHRHRLEAIGSESLGEPGFPSLRSRVMEITRRETVEEYLRELGSQVDRQLNIRIGGSVALIVAGYLSRRTEDIDVVDEVPAEIRSQHRLLNDLEKRYGLHLGHFQSHYLPAGWDARVHSLAPFGRLRVSLVDVYDVFLSKLFSARSKDLDDLRALKAQLDKAIVVRRLCDSSSALLKEAAFREKAEKNWYILFGESLPA
jgi:hypothetical protein